MVVLDVEFHIQMAVDVLVVILMVKIQVGVLYMPLDIWTWGDLSWEMEARECKGKENILREADISELSGTQMEKSGSVKAHQTPSLPPTGLAWIKNTYSNLHSE